jgi:uncharacterized tellurite resistance protein B-like protein
METILDIIKRYESKLKSSIFQGNIYFPNSDEKLIIDRAVFNKMLDKINEQFGEATLFPNQDGYYLAFKYEVYEKSDTIWREDRNYYLATIINFYGIFSIWSEETTGYEKKPDNFDIVSWEEIEDIQNVKNDEFGRIIRIFIKNKTYHIDLLMNRFGNPKYFDHASFEIMNLLKEITLFNNNIKNNSKKEYDDLYTKITELPNNLNVNYEEALNLLEIFKNKYVDLNKDDDNSRFYYNNKIKFTEDIKQAIKIFEDYKKLVGEKLGPATTFDIAKVYENSQDYLSAVNYFSYSEENYKDSEIKNKIGISKENVYTKLISNFATIDYAKRKLVFIADEILHTTMDGMVVLKKNELPDDILFPLNHPKVNEVYVCHPINKSSYLPLKEFEKELFTDRLHELMLLLGSLGAKKIDISSQERNRDTQNQSNNTQIDASLNITISSVQGNYENNKKKESSLEHELNIKFHQTLNPKKAPFVPGGLVWYHSNLGWQRLTNQRLNGNLLTHTEIISTKQVETLSTNEINKLNAEISLLLGRIKTSVGYTNEMDIKSLTEKNYTLEVTVEFEDIDNLQQKNSSESVLTIENNNSVNLDNHKKYAEEVQFMLDDDGIIDEKERRILDRLKNSLGLTEQQAIDIESKLQITEQNEREYIDEFITIMNDGEITDKERRLLNRLAKSLGITEKKVIEIEKKYTKQV